jgi:hypothetical protein
VTGAQIGAQIGRRSARTGHARVTRAEKLPARRRRGVRRVIRGTRSTKAWCAGARRHRRGRRRTSMDLRTALGRRYAARRSRALSIASREAERSCSAVRHPETHHLGGTGSQGAHCTSCMDCLPAYNVRSIARSSSLYFLSRVEARRPPLDPGEVLCANYRGQGRPRARRGGHQECMQVVGRLTLLRRRG